MTLKRFNQIKIILVVILAIAISQLVAVNNYFLPLILVVLASLILLFLRRRLTEVIADERDYALGGRSAIYSIQIYCWVAVIAMFFFYYLGKTDQKFEIVGMTLAMSTCLLMLLYATIFRIKAGFNTMDKKVAITAFIIAIFISIIIALSV